MALTKSFTIGYLRAISFSIDRETNECYAIYGGWSDRAAYLANPTAPIARRKVPVTLTAQQQTTVWATVDGRAKLAPLFTGAGDAQD